MKRKYMSPIFTIIAMVLLLISQLISDEPMDWLGYLAIGVIILGVVSLIMLYRQVK